MDHLEKSCCEFGECKCHHSCLGLPRWRGAILTKTQHLCDETKRFAQTFPLISTTNPLDIQRGRAFSALSSIVVCRAQPTINSLCRSEVRAHIRAEPPTLCREHFLGQSVCRSQWEVSGQRSKVRAGVRIKLMSYLLQIPKIADCPSGRIQISPLRPR